MVLYDIDGNKIDCEILFTFERDEKNFVVYFDENTENLLASFYYVDGDNWIISPIELDSDFDIVDEEIRKRGGLEHE